MAIVKEIDPFLWLVFFGNHTMTNQNIKNEEIKEAEMNQNNSASFFGVYNLTLKQLIKCHVIGLPKELSFSSFMIHPHFFSDKNNIFFYTIK